MPALSTVNTRASAMSNDKGSRSFFGAIKDAFKSKSKMPSGGTPRGRRLSVLSATSTDTKSTARHDEELEKRRANCLAIRTAKREPIEVQNLLIDCEFCNPPPDYGIDIPIYTPQFTAQSVHVPDPGQIKDPEDELSWNVGLEEWVKIRDWWNKPTANAQPKHYLPKDFAQDKYFVVYDKMVRFTRPPKEPLNLDDVVQIVKAGWVGEGAWPTHPDPNDRWSDDETAMETAGSGRSRAPSVAPKREEDNGTHVMFTDKPHPRLAANGDNDKASDKSGDKSGDKANGDMPDLSRVQSTMSGLTLAPTRSNVSSLVSLTDEE